MKNLTLLLFFIFTLTVLNGQNFWEKTNYPTDNSSLYSVYSLIENSSNHILAGTYAKGVFKSTDNGNTWTESGLANQWVVDLTKTNDNTIYAASIGSNLGSGVFKSTNNGADWVKVWDALTGINCIYSDNIGNVYVGLNFTSEQSGIYKSSDAGSSWSKIFDLTANVYDIIKLPNGRILAAGYGKVFYSDNETTWNNTTNGFVNFTPSAFVLNSKGEVFLATLGYGIYKSVDNGITWTNKTGAGFEYSSLVYLPDGKMYAGTRGYWVYRSTDNGDNWQLINSGMGQDKYVLSLFASKSGYLYAGLDYYGIYRSVEKVVTSVDNEYETPTDFQLSQNYPNPFNPNTSIEYKVPSNELINLKVFDVLGNEVAVLVNEVKSPGSYKVDFNASALSSGVYFYRLTSSNGAILTKKLLLLR